MTVEVQLFYGFSKDTQRSDIIFSVLSFYQLKVLRWKKVKTILDPQAHHLFNRTPPRPNQVVVVIVVVVVVAVVALRHLRRLPPWFPATPRTCLLVRSPPN